MRKTVLFALIALLCLLPAGGMILCIGAGTAYAGSAWKDEFAEVCGKTHHAMELSPDELWNVIERCTRLEEHMFELQGPQGSERKVYARRLKMCKDLYVYTLEFREKERKAGDGR